MNIREAILKTADNLEQMPEAYRYLSSHVADCDNDPTCLLGKIGYFRGMTSGGCIMNQFLAKEIIGVTFTEFTSRITFLADPMRAYTRDAESAAIGLRRYADKYHPAQDVIPASVRKIFEEKMSEQLYDV